LPEEPGPAKVGVAKGLGTRSQAKVCRPGVKEEPTVSKALTGATRFQAGQDLDGLLVVNPYRNDPPSLLGD